MKKITRIEYQKNNKDRVNIYLDDKFGFGVDLNIMIKYGLAKNMELDDEFITRILISEDKAKLYNYAISVLSRGSKSEKELKLKLADKGYDNESINSAIEKLKENKYIDDDYYCKKFINDKINISKYGKRRIKEALVSKGIDRQLIEKNISYVSQDDEINRAYALAEKKLKSLTDAEPIKKKMKISSFLLNKGFDYEIVNKISSKLLKVENEGFED